MHTTRNRLADLKLHDSRINFLQITTELAASWW